jgi:transposase InsO family protein
LDRLRQEARVIERFQVIELARREGVTAAAREFECSRTTVYQLLARYERGGLQGLLNRPRGPRSPINPQVAEMIVELKVNHPHRSTAKIQLILDEEYGWPVSRQTIWRVLSGRGLARLVEQEPLRRFERPQPNQLWQMDLKEDVRISTGKAHLLAVVDDASRFCLGGEWIPNKREPAVLGALANVLGRWGLPEAILTDRGTVFYGPATRRAGLTTYQLALETLGMRAVFARAYKARTKGKVEKFIQTVKHDFLRELKLEEISLPELNACWQKWVSWYNERRPHSSLGNLPPAHRFRASQRPAPRELKQLLQVEVMRKVNRDATISLNRQQYPVPPELIGRHVWVGMLGDTITIEHSGRTVATYTRQQKCSDLELQKRSVLRVT